MRKRTERSRGALSFVSATTSVGDSDASREAVFGSRVVVQPNGCWAFNGDLDTYHTFTALRGEGKRSGRQVNVRAHRYAYEILVGPIDEGLHLHHKCQHPGCVNPAHLEPLTPKEHRAAHRGVA